MSEKALYIFENQEIKKSDIKRKLEESGVRQGDFLMVHSDVSSFGKMGEIRSRDQFLNEILDAFLDVLGPDGTLIVPTYTWSFGKGEKSEVFDVNRTPSTTGTFSEFVRKDKRAIRSDDAMVSHAAIGKDASLMLGLSRNSHGEGGLFELLAKKDGKIMNFGADFSITFLHHIEYVFNVNYRFIKRFRGILIDRDGKKTQSEVSNYVRFLYEHGCDVDKDMTPLRDELLARDLLEVIRLGASQIYCCSARDCLQVGLEMLSKNQYVFLKHDPRIIINKE